MKKHSDKSFTVDPKAGTFTVSPRSKLLLRGHPKMEHAQALEEVHVKLAVATEFFDNYEDGGRYGVFKAILDVVQYFSDIGIPRATLKPLSAVAAAIADADRGIESSIFKPDRGLGSGTPPTSVGRLEFNGHLATITDCCVQHCKAEGERPYVERGCRRAASMINEQWGLSYTWVQLRELREAVQQKENGIDRVLFDLAKSSKVARQMPLVWAELLLKHDWFAPPPKIPEKS